MPSEFVIQKIQEARAAADRGDGAACRRHLEHAVSEDPDGLKAMCDLADQITGR